MILWFFKGYFSDVLLSCLSSLSLSRIFFLSIPAVCCLLCQLGSLDGVPGKKTDKGRQTHLQKKPNHSLQPFNFSHLISCLLFFYLTYTIHSPYTVFLNRLHIHVGEIHPFADMNWDQPVHRYTLSSSLFSLAATIPRGQDRAAILLLHCLPRCTHSRHNPKSQCYG